MISTPACCSLRMLSSNAWAIWGSTASLYKPSGTIALKCLSETRSASTANACITVQMSATVCASGPMLSSVVESGQTPMRERRPEPGLKPAKPLRAAGMRTEPEVSVPMLYGTMPKATDKAAPLEEPPGASASLCDQALAGVPKCGFKPKPEKANSVRLVRPNDTAPMLSSSATATASCAFGAACAVVRLAARVTSPAWSNKSFQLSGIPSSKPSACLFCQRAVAACAACRARDSVRRINTESASCARCRL